MSATEPTASASVRFLVHDPFAEAVYCRRSFAEAAGVANHLGCSLLLQCHYGGGQLLTPEGVIARYRREGELWRVEPPQARNPFPRHQPG